MTDEELLDAFPRVRIDQDNAAYYRGLLEQRLMVNRCGDCGHWHQPPRPICPKCWSWAISPKAVAGEGRVALVTVLRQGPARDGIDYADGHAVIAVELDEQPGLRIAGGVVARDTHQVRLGARVRIVWRDVDGASPGADFELVS